MNDTLQLTTSTRRSTNNEGILVVDRELQLTTSTRRSTLKQARELVRCNTSTHDLHTEVDLLPILMSIIFMYFNSRPPHGGRLRYR